jgi:hypothetical protein
MSAEAISWALNLAPVPAGRRGQPSSACKFVLVGLANHGGPDRSGAFPPVATLGRCSGLSERTVRTCLDRLEAGGIISPCDPDLVAARIKRAGRRPQGWDLDLILARDDLNEPGVTVPESQSPVRRAGLAPRERPHHGRPPNGVQPPHPAGLMDHLDHQVQQLHLAAATRCTQRTGRVQPTRPRGAAVAPEPSREPSPKQSAAPAPHLRARPLPAGGAAGRRGLRRPPRRLDAGHGQPDAEDPERRPSPSTVPVRMLKFSPQNPPGTRSAGRWSPPPRAGG